MTNNLAERLYHEALLEVRRLFPDLAIPDGVRKAFLSNPRHEFLAPSDMTGPASTNSDDWLEKVYRNEGIPYGVQDAAEDAASSSQPSINLLLLSWLNLAEGDTVAEVGAGRGWLSTMASHLVGEGGRVVGIEVLPSLVDFSRNNNFSRDRRNLSYICGDIEDIDFGDQTFDKVVCTASFPTIPNYIGSLVVPGGLLIIPIRNRAGHDELRAFRKRDGYWISAECLPSNFVRAARYERESRFIDAENLSKHDACLEKKFWFSSPDTWLFNLQTIEFRNFLSNFDERFALFEEIQAMSLGRPVIFGVFFEERGAWASVAPGTIRSNDSEAMATIVECLELWFKLGMPPASRISLAIADIEGSLPRVPGQYFDTEQSGSMRRYFVNGE